MIVATGGRFPYAGLRVLQDHLLGKTGEYTMTFENLVSILEKTLNSELQVEDSTCGFAVSDKEEGSNPLDIILTYVPEVGSVLMFTDLGEVPPEGRELFYRTLLEGNNLFQATGGATPALDSETGHVRIQKSEDLDIFSNDVEARLDKFVNAAIAWNKIILDYNGKDTHSEDSAADDANEQHPFGGFMQV